MRGFGAEIFVLRPEGVQTYVEREKTEIENDRNLMEKFVEFQPYTVNLSSFIVFELFYFVSRSFSVAPKCASPCFLFEYDISEALFRANSLALARDKEHGLKERTARNGIYVPV